MDGAFDYAENADHDMIQDLGYIGIATGLEVTEEATPDLTVDIAVGRAYDQDGQRIAVDATQNLDLSVDSNAVSTAVAGGGNEKWISVYIAFDRNLSDPRVDGNGSPLDYERSESFQFIVDQGAEAAAGSNAVHLATNTENYALTNGETLEVVINNSTTQTVTFLTGDFVDINNATAAEVAAVFDAQLNAAGGTTSGGAVGIRTLLTGTAASVRIAGGTAASVFAFPSTPTTGAGGPSQPALRADALLLADVLFRNGGTTIVDNDSADGGTEHVIDMTSRREDTFTYQGAFFQIREGSITDFVSALAQEVSDRITSFDATTIAYTPTANLVSTNIQDALDELAPGYASGIQATSGTVDGATVVGSTTTTVLNIDFNSLIPVDSNAWVEVRVVLIEEGGTSQFAVFSFENRVSRGVGNITYDTSVTPFTSESSTVSLGFQTASGGNMRIAAVKSDAGNVDVNIAYSVRYQIVEAN